MKRKYTRESIAEAVKSSVSLADALRKLGKKWSGGSQQNIKRWIAEYGIDTSHFLGQRANCGKTHKGGSRKKTWEEILVENENLMWREKTFLLRRAMIESGAEYRCVECGNEGEWRGSQLALEINHKDCNWRNNRRENLEFVCPNCHSQKTIAVVA